jgi:hypothetical protein|tara:strand:- start:647 stop:877 length:231 start_codon:yes stop_codon:yes gene_type:complete
MKPIRKNFPDGAEGMKQFQKAMKIYTARMMAKGLGIKPKTTKSPGNVVRENATTTKFNDIKNKDAKVKKIINSRKN